jgi:uncharacterized membrane protein
MASHTSSSSASFVNIITNPRNRFLVSILAALLIYFLMPLSKEYWDIRLILAYVVGVSIELILVTTMMVFSSAQETMLRSRRLEPSNLGVLVTVFLFSLGSLVAVALMLNNSHNRPAVVANIHMGLSLLAIFLSWLFVHTYFGLHYARIYYDQKRKEVRQLVVEDLDADDFIGGLDFPMDGLADYWDFLYYSFTIAMCYQTSDISITSVKMRRLTLVHSILSFIYVSCIIGLVVNLVSNVV